MQNRRIVRNEKEGDFDYHRLEDLHQMINHPRYYELSRALFDELSNYDYTEKRINIISRFMPENGDDIMLEDFMMHYPALMEHTDSDGNRPIEHFYDLAFQRKGKLYTQSANFFLAAIALGYDVKDNISDKRYAQIIKMISKYNVEYYGEVLASVMISLAEEIEFEFNAVIPFRIAWESGKFHQISKPLCDNNRQERQYNVGRNDIVSLENLNAVTVSYPLIEVFRGYCDDKSKIFWKKFNAKLQSLWPLANRYITEECQTVRLFFKLANFTTEDLYPLSNYVMWYAKNVRFALQWDAVQSVVKLLCSKNIGTIDLAAKVNMPDVLSYLLAKLNEVRSLKKQAGIIDDELMKMLKHPDVDVKTIQMLIHYGADIHNIKYDKTPLIHASCAGNLTVVEFLLNKGVDVNAGKYSALIYAAEFGYTDIMRLLIKCGADLYALGALRYQSKDNALSTAIMNYEFDAAILLLQSGSAYRYSSCARERDIIKVFNYAQGLSCEAEAIIEGNNPIKSLQLLRDQFAKLRNILVSTGLNIFGHKKGVSLNHQSFFMNKGYKIIAQILESLENYAKQVDEPGNFALLFKLHSQYTHEELYISKMNMLNSFEDYEVGDMIVSSILKKAYEIIKRPDDLSML